MILHKIKILISIFKISYLFRNHQIGIILNGKFIYNYMVFAKKKYPDNWEEKLLEGARNYIVYDKIWGDEKVKQKIK